MPRPQRKLSRLDWFVLAGLIGAAVFLLYRMFFNLNYNWNWGIIPTYLLRYDAERQRWVANALLEGIAVAEDGQRLWLAAERRRHKDRKRAARREQF